MKYARLVELRVNEVLRCDAYPGSQVFKAEGATINHWLQNKRFVRLTLENRPYTCSGLWLYPLQGRPETATYEIRTDPALVGSMKENHDPGQ